jgi:hypothetical protein
MVATGRTGLQSVKFITAPRFYIKSPDVTATPVLVKSNGTLPSGWTDLGVVNGLAKITYTKSTKEVRTGIEQVLRGIYIDKKTASVEADLAQFDDVVVESLTGLTASIITAGSIVMYGLGSESIVTKAVLLVAQNILDGKEVQLYNPAAFVSLSYNSSGDETSVKAMCDFPLFTWQGNDTAFTHGIFA